MSDPMTVFYAVTAAYRVGGKRWKALSHRLREVLVETEERGLELGGTWQPSGPFGADGGRVCTTAVHILVLEFYYRYSRLAVAS